MYKELFRQVIAIMSQPGKAWKALAAKEEKGDEYLSRFVYPLIGLVTLAAFVGVLFTERHFDVEKALKMAIRALISAFCGFHLAAYGLNLIWRYTLERGDELLLCRRFTGYASAPVFAINMVLSVLPEADFFFLQVFTLYTIYVVWEGAAAYMQVKGKARIDLIFDEFRVDARVWFMVTASGLIILLPRIISWILFVLMPGLRG